jgi:hypothetical protein
VVPYRDYSDNSPLSLEVWSKMSKNLTLDQLNEAKYNYMKDLVLPTTINEVTFYDAKAGCLGFRYKNARGLIFVDNGYLGRTENGEDYYLLWRLSCSYSEECKYNPTFEPNLSSASAAVIASWNKFIGN